MCFKKVLIGSLMSLIFVPNLAVYSYLIAIQSQNTRFATTDLLVFVCLAQPFDDCSEIVIY